MENVINCIEDIKEKINSQDYINLYNYISDLPPPRAQSVPHKIYFNLKTSFVVLMEDGEEKEKQVETSITEDVVLKRRLFFTHGMDMEIEYLLIDEGINPYRISTKFFKHQDKVVKKLLKIRSDSDVSSIEQFNNNLSIIGVYPQ